MKEVIKMAGYEPHLVLPKEIRLRYADKWAACLWTNQKEVVFVGDYYSEILKQIKDLGLDEKRFIIFHIPEAS